MAKENRTYTSLHRDFYREMPDSEHGIQRVAVRSPSDGPKESGIRLHCVQYKTSWNLQVRGFFQTANYRKGKTWYYATASLGVEELRALRDACDTALADVK